MHEPDAIFAGNTPARPATLPPVDPAVFTSDRERLQLVCDAGCQLEALLALLVAAGVDPGPSPDATLSIAIRCRDLAEAVIYALRPEGDSIENLQRTVYGSRHAGRPS